MKLVKIAVTVNQLFFIIMKRKAYYQRLYLSQTHYMKNIGVWNQYKIFKKTFRIPIKPVIFKTWISLVKKKPKHFGLMYLTTITPFG